MLLESCEQKPPLWETDYILPNDTIPTAYNICLYPHFNTCVLGGHVTIHINVTEKKRFLWLHAVNMNIKEKKLSRVINVHHWNCEFKITKAFFYDPHDFYVIALRDPLPPGPYKLMFKFKGLLNYGDSGLYMYKYRNEYNKLRYLVFILYSSFMDLGPLL